MASPEALVATDLLLNYCPSLSLLISMLLYFSLLLLKRVLFLLLFLLLAAGMPTATSGTAG